jgi:hypothetical protein
LNIGLHGANVVMKHFVLARQMGGYEIAVGITAILLGFGVWVLGEALLPTEAERAKKASAGRRISGNGAA